ncbi:MAG: STAS domain-containing protein [Vampirovibrionales bacterium]|nr:STAS domain-containing protein [Vampirovibrionales bacterium]
MEITNRYLEDCVILDVAEDYFGYPKTVLFKAHVSKLLDDKQDTRHAHIVLNLSNVKMLDSFGIAAIISILKLCREQKGTLTLYGLNEQVTRLIEMTHMDRVLDIWSSEAQAVSQAVKSK